jgi:hypothetical protein
MSINGHRLSSAGLKQQKVRRGDSSFWVLTTCTKICQKSLNLKYNFHKGLMLLYLALSAKWQDSNENEQRNFKLFLPNLIWSAASLSSLMKLATVLFLWLTFPLKMCWKNLSLHVPFKKYVIQRIRNQYCCVRHFWKILSYFINFKGLREQILSALIRQSVKTFFVK